MRAHLALLVLLYAVGISACGSSHAVKQVEQRTTVLTTAPVELLTRFLDEFYSGRAYSNLTSVFDQYTDWPDFGPGDSIKIAKDQRLRLVTETDETAEIEVQFKVVGEESNLKIEIHESEEIQLYRLQKHGRDWKIQEPIHIPYVSISGEVDRLRKIIERASERIAKRDFTIDSPKEFFESLIADAQACIGVLESHR